jgi:hypothetical protein
MLKKFKPILKRRERKSGYGWSHTEYQCPICKTWHYKTAKYIHFSAKAKKEALLKASNLLKKTPHLDFYLKHTKEVVRVNREWVSIL